MARTAPELIEFPDGERAAAVAAVVEVLAAGRGWVNVQPEVDEDQRVTPPPSALASIFRASGAPVPVVTLTAPQEGRRGRRPAQLGLAHGAGRRAAPALAQAGRALPPGVAVVQDHVRRGLVLDLPDPVDGAAVLGWALEAAKVLCPVPLTGRWVAEVYRG